MSTLIETLRAQLAEATEKPEAAAANPYGEMGRLLEAESALLDSVYAHLPALLDVVEKAGEVVGWDWQALLGDTEHTPDGDTALAHVAELESALAALNAPAKEGR